MDPKVVQEEIVKYKTLSEEGWGGWCGYWLPDGWADLVFKLHNDLLMTDPDYKVVQVKEKFGELRYYVEPGLSDAGKQLISEAETKSLSICQDCGKPGSLRGHGWVAILCDEHNDIDKTDRGYGSYS